MTSRRLGHRAPLLWLAAPMIAGLAAGRAGVLAPVPWVLGAALLAAVVAVFASWRLPRWTMPAVVVTMLLVGLASYGLRVGDAGLEALAPREARLVLRLDRVFGAGESTLSQSGLAKVLRADAHVPVVAHQTIYFHIKHRKGDPSLVRSTVVSVRGVLEPLPDAPPAGSFDAYLADAGVRFRFTRMRVLAIERPPARYRVWLERTAARLNGLLGVGVATKRPDLTAVYRAMMLGQKQELSDEQKQLFMHSGTMHLFAINGLHIGVIALALHALLMVLRCPRPLAALLTLAVLWIDVDTTGASPSAVRAWLLVAAYESAFVLRRPANGLAALSGAALLVLLVEPLAIFSASFQMSYGAVLAILAYGLPLAERLEKKLAPWRSLPEATWSAWQRLVAWALRWFWPVAGIGLAAALVSAITGPAFFQVFAPGGFFANLVLVPLAMLVIVAGFAAVVAGLGGLTLLGSLFNHAAVLVLAGIDALIRLGARLPAGWWEAHWRAPWMGHAALVALLTTIVAGYAAGWRGRVFGWWLPFAVVAAAMILGVKFG